MRSSQFCVLLWFLCPFIAQPVQLSQGQGWQHNVPIKHTFLTPYYFDIHTYTNLEDRGSTMLRNVGNPSLRGAKAPKMTITSHIVENTSLYLSSDGKHSQFRPAAPNTAWTETNVLWNGNGGRAVLCRGTITQPGGRARGTTKIGRGDRANKWKS